MKIDKIIAALLCFVPVKLLPINKKGQAFSMMMIIGIAILALLVLVVVFLVAGKMKGFGSKALGTMG